MVSIVPQPYELYFSKPTLQDIGGLPVVQLLDANVTFANSLWKRGLDFTLGSALLLLSIPFIMVAAASLLSTTSRPLRRESRCGQFGKLFGMWRLGSGRNPECLTRLEAILQQLSFTELPQLWNVVRGEMSLVGPRPEPQDRAKHYSDWQRRRLNVKPGMTGLAQVHGLRDKHPSDAKVRFDLQYIMQSSFLFDISLLLQTIWTLLGRLSRLHSLVSTAPTKEGTNTPDRLFKRTLPDAHSTQSSAD
jgi:lipopolysaccharide/colanic/teichoic acid biosynthesis glycosyltransferase